MTTHSTVSPAVDAGRRKAYTYRDDPEVQRWLQRIERGRQSGPLRRPERPSLAQRFRWQWWGWREGSVLYFYNHILAHIPFHALRRFFYRRIMRLGRQTSILMGLRLFYPGRLIIGDHTAVNANVLLDSRAGLWIGDSVSISDGAQLWSGGHDINSLDFRSYGGVIVVEDYVWIAANAVVAGGTTGDVLTLGEGCVVTAGSVVVRDVEPYTVVAGNPARKIAARSRDLDYRLNFFPPLR